MQIMNYSNFGKLTDDMIIFIACVNKEKELVIPDF